MGEAGAFGPCLLGCGSPRKARRIAVNIAKLPELLRKPRKVQSAVPVGSPPPASHTPHGQSVAGNSSVAVGRPMLAIERRPKIGNALVARRDLSRQYAEFIDAPIADEHLDRRYS